MDEISEEIRRTDQHVTRLEHEARQPRLAMEADEPAGTTKVVLLLRRPPCARESS